VEDRTKRAEKQIQYLTGMISENRGEGKGATGGKLVPPKGRGKVVPPKGQGKVIPPWRKGEGKVSGEVVAKECNSVVEEIRTLQRSGAFSGSTGLSYI
jgi:hypothetical protein